jgi:O-acetyl-ADP-ribose deacetylase (regulator of RNase III)
MDLKIKLCDINQEMVNAWKNCFESYPEVEITKGNIFEIDADALVSPANSFGFMGGGLDYHINKFFDFKLESKVQNVIRKKYNGFLPVGHALIVETNHEKFQFLISAPTMEVPLNVASTINAYLAMRAILMEIINHNQQNENKITSVVIPGLAGSTGRMPFTRIAFQMLKAYENIIKEEMYSFKSLSEAKKLYLKLKKY